MAGEYQIPFDKDGNMLGYPEERRIAEWRDNYAFEDQLLFVGFERGRSAAHLMFKSINDGKRYEMFLKDLGVLLALPRCDGFDRGAIKGKWTFVKRGMNYGIKPAEEREGNNGQVSQEACGG